VSFVRTSASAPDAALLLGEDDERVSLSSIWAERNTVIVFLRHFG
jgi:hypothetical protein